MLYDEDVAALIERLIEVYRSEHSRKPSVFPQALAHRISGDLGWPVTVAAYRDRVTLE